MVSEGGEAKEAGGEEKAAKSWPIKYVVLRTTARQEMNVALMLESIAKGSGAKGLYAIVVPPEIRGYLIIEAEGLHIVHRLARDIKHVKGKAMGSLKRDEVQKLIKTVSPIEKIRPGDTVEIVSGPFKGLKAKVLSVDMQKNVVVVRMLEASYSMEATIPGDDVRPVKKK